MITEAQKEAQTFIQAFIDEGFLPPAARIAALIAIDKVIDATTKKWGGVNPTNGHQVNHVQVNPYWVEVKTEIEKV